MRLKAISIMLALVLLLASFSVLVGCNGSSDKTVSPSETSNAGGETDSETEDRSEESGSETETAPDLDSITYENGEIINGAGHSWGEDPFVLEKHDIDESAARDISAEQLKSILNDMDADRSGEIYRVQEPIYLDSDTKYYGCRATVIATEGIIVENASSIVIKELILVGNITVKNSNEITFFKLDIKGGDIAVSVDGASYDIAFKQCRIDADNTAICSEADLTTVYLCYISASNGITVTGNDFAIQDTKIDAEALGISASGAYSIIRENTISATQSGVGIKIAEGCENALVALNVIEDAQRSMEISGSFNCSVLLNSAIRIIAKNNTNLYVIENNLGGAIELESNKYLICDGNKLPPNEELHPVVDVNNTEYNGDNLHNINERVEYGANENLLPHTNKDLFLGMERRSVVTDLSDLKSNNLNNYIRTRAKEGSVVIVPPGVYSTTARLTLQASHANTTVYAYGVYDEIDELGPILFVQQSANVTVKGLTIGYDTPSSGQVYVLEKLGGNKVLVINAAGYNEGFGKSDTTVYNGGNSYTYDPGTVSPWHNMSGNYKVVQKNSDGTMVLEFTGSDASKYYGTMPVGSIITCRLAGDNSHTLSVIDSKNVLFKDCVIYGYTAALAITGSGQTKGVQLERVHNTAHSSYIIDKETYDRYRTLEETYGIDLEISIDSLGRYRGSKPRMGSVDATHIIGTTQGFSATSCLFEQMCDDGSNQRASSSRLAGLVDNGDGTYTVYVKGSLAETYLELHVQSKKTTATPSMMQIPLKGETVYAYTSKGETVFDTKILTDAVKSTSPACVIAHNDDANGDGKCDDGFCDTCGAVTHYDLDRNDKCDSCGAAVHTHTKGDGKCGGVFWDAGYKNVSYCTATISDANGDHLNDEDGIPIITDKAQNIKFDPEKSLLTFQRSYTTDGGKTFPIITYSTYVYEFKVSADAVNPDAIEGYDLLDNAETMTNKVLVDNLSRNSAGFTFDNVMIRDALARGVLAKTSDVTIKHCTFRNISSSGILLSCETSWGESTVPRNISILSCLFDNTTHMFKFKNNGGYAPIVIQGLGSAGGTVTVSETTLPVKNITIDGCKFTNISQTIAITISGAQNVRVTNNVFEPHTAAVGGSIGKIIANGCLNVEFSNNTYPDLIGGDITKIISANNYKNIFGSDVTNDDGTPIFPDSTN